MSAARNANATIPYGGRPSQAVMETLASTVSKNTKASYIRENVNFIVWLFDKDADEFIHDTFLLSLHKAHEEDEERGLQKTRRNLRSTITQLS